MRRQVKPILWPAWRYGPNGEAEIFQLPDDVPAGWTDIPLEKRSIERVDNGVLDRGQLMAALEAHGVEVSPLWPDALLEIKLKEIG